MKNLFICFCFAFFALKEKLKGWRYPLIRRNFTPLRFRIGKDRMETFVHLKLKHSRLKEFLERRGKDTVLVTEMTKESLWVNVYLADLTTDDEDLGPCHVRTTNELRGLDGTYTFLAEGGDIRRPLRNLRVYWLNNEPVMSFKVSWTVNERAYIEDILQLEGPFINSPDFDINLA